MQNVTHRLKQFIDHLEIDVFPFEKAIGVPKGLIQRPITTGSGFNVKALQKICTKYPELNLNWLITGTGEMLLQQGEKEQTLNEPSSNYTTQSAAEKKIMQLQEELINCMKEVMELKKNSSLQVAA